MKMRIRPLALSLAACLSLLNVAEAADDQKPVVSSPFRLKNRSSFTTPETARHPFWPIGYTPRPKDVAQAAAPTPAFTLEAKNFNVTSILMGAQSISVINGRPYGEGEYLRPPRASKSGKSANLGVPENVRIRVQRIYDGRVVLQAQNQSVTVDLKRPELVERQDSEELLLPVDQR